MDLFALGKTVAKFAPILGTAIAGPGGAVLGSLVAQAFGVDISNTDKLIQRITENPESAIKLAEIESHEKIELQRLVVQSDSQHLESDNKQKELSNQNTANARLSNIQLSTTFPQFLSMLVALGFFACIYWIAAYSQEKADHDVLYLLMGGVSAAFATVLNYWLGDSANKRNM